MNLLRLRQETAAEHAATEDIVPLMSPSLTRKEYIAVLRKFHRVAAAWDRWADAHMPSDLLPLREGRRRATLLQDDLFAMGERAAPLDNEFLRRMEDTAVAGEPRAVFLGRMYVFEGSTLGGQYIAQHVEDRLGIPHGQGNSFFAGYGDRTASRWREFRTVLAALPDSDEETVIASAKNMFGLFAEAMSGENGDSRSLAGARAPAGGGAIAARITQ